MLRVVVVVAVLLSPACGGSPSDAFTSGVRGTVVAGPTCPVETVQSPCPDAPIEARLTFVKRGEAGASSVSSKADGTFEIRLAPGTYDVSGEPVGGAMFCKPDEVTVEADSFASLTYLCDTGIR